MASGQFSFPALNLKRAVRTLWISWPYTNILLTFLMRTGAKVTAPFFYRFTRLSMPGVRNSPRFTSVHSHAAV